MPGRLRRHDTHRGFSASLKQAIQAQEARSKRTYNELAREFYLQRFLARVFADPDNRWVLKGGTNLLTRFPEAARHSQDLDLMYRSPQPDALDAAVAELRRVAGSQPDLDPFTFTLRSRGAITGGAGGMRIMVTTSYGAAELHKFPIDLVADLPIAAQLDQHRPRPVVELDAVSDLPVFTLYPLPDQVADKVCAMYERSGVGQSPPGRYRDLIDLLVIVGNHTLDAAMLAQALAKEAARRSITLPSRLQAPASTWHSNYPREAARSTLPRDLHDLDAALATAAVCFDPILDGTTKTGTWNPDKSRWTANLVEDSEGERPT